MDEHRLTPLRAVESTLNDTERNLRKSRLQMNDLAKERDKLSTTNADLRSELVAARTEADTARHSVLQERTQFDARLSEERKQKEVARRQLENRLEEMQNSKLAKKSKFKCALVSFLVALRQRDADLLSVCSCF